MVTIASGTLDLPEDRARSIRDGGASCCEACGLRLFKPIVCVSARRISQPDSSDLGACRSCCDAT
eukprot:COSAG06_NODE_18787_length_869_cov_0.641558_1_plen_64_part_10